MRRFKDAPIKRKLVTLTTATSLIVLIVAASGFLASTIVSFKTQRARTLELLARVVAENATAALTFADPTSAEITLQSLKAEPHIIFAAVFDANGQLFVRYNRDSASRVIPLPPLSSDSVTFSDDYSEVFQTITLDGSKVGTLFLRADLTDLYAAIRSSILLAAIIFSVSVAFAYLVSSWLQGLISTPIMNLVTTARTIAETKEYEVRAVKSGADEIGLGQLQPDARRDSEAR
jgi:uncharacterized membrane protein affecting hemolysin expression